MFSPSAYRCKRNKLIPLYQTLICSILEYGAPIYSLAPKSQLALLDLIQNFAIRICTGAFRTSPHLSICSDSGIPPLHYQRFHFSATLISSILYQANTHAHQLLFNTKLKYDTYCRAHTSLSNFLQKSLDKKKWLSLPSNYLHFHPSMDLHHTIC